MPLQDSEGKQTSIKQDRPTNRTNELPTDTDRYTDGQTETERPNRQSDQYREAVLEVSYAPVRDPLSPRLETQSGVLLEGPQTQTTWGPPPRWAPNRSWGLGV